MKCHKCKQPCYRHLDQVHNLTGFLNLDHSDVETCAYHCNGCKRTFCGSCCHPAWESLKRQKGLSGPALAKMLNQDSNALFSEDASCPVCRGKVEQVFKGLLPPPKKPATNYRFTQLRRTWDDVKVSGTLAVSLMTASACLIFLGHQWAILLILAAVACLSYCLENGSAPCPSCGRMLRNVHHTSEGDKNPGAPCKCPQCGCRSRSQDGWMVELPREA